MGRITASMAKNSIRRALTEIAFPYPSREEVETLWRFFECRCCYCGEEIFEGSRTGHLDHLVASSRLAAVSIHDFVLACARCNGDLKRDADWRDFLLSLDLPGAIASARQKMIESWISMKPPLAVDHNRISLGLETEIATAIQDFEASVSRIRKLLGRKVDMTEAPMIAEDN